VSQKKARTKALLERDLVGQAVPGGQVTSRLFLRTPVSLIAQHELQAIANRRRTGMLESTSALRMRHTAIVAALTGTAITKVMVRSEPSLPGMRPTHGIALSSAAEDDEG
jgi:hypothetical protein